MRYLILLIMFVLFNCTDYERDNVLDTKGTNFGGSTDTQKPTDKELIDPIFKILVHDYEVFVGDEFTKESINLVAKDSLGNDADLKDIKLFGDINTANPGKRTLRLVYKGITDSVLLFVKEDQTVIEGQYNLVVSKFIYTVKVGSTFDPKTKIIYEATNPGGEKENDKVVFSSAINLNKVGEYTITLSYNGISREVTLKVVEGDVIEIGEPYFEIFTDTIFVTESEYNDDNYNPLSHIVYTAYDADKNDVRADVILLDFNNLSPDYNGKTIYFKSGLLTDSLFMKFLFVFSEDTLSTNLKVLKDTASYTLENTPVDIYIAVTPSTLSYDSVKWSAPKNGSASFKSMKFITYTPNNNFTGSDSFTYKVLTKNGWSNEVTVTIKVNPTFTLPTEYVVLDNFDNNRNFCSFGTKNPNWQSDLGCALRTSDAENLPENQLGAWYVYDDSIDGGTSSATPDYRDYFGKGFDPNGYEGQCLTLNIQLGVGLDNLDNAFYGVGCNITDVGSYTDFSKLTSISFYAKGSGTMDCLFLTKVTDKYAWGSMMAPFSLSSSWQLVTISTSDINPEPWSPPADDKITWSDTKSAVTGIRFQTNAEKMKAGDSVVFSIDDIHLNGMSISDFQ